MSVALLRDLAVSPRPTGSDAIADARTRVARALEAAGFEVRERPFEFSAFPGRFAVPLMGVTMLAIVAVAGHLGARGHRWIPLVLTVGGGFVAKIATEWLTKRGVLAMPLMRRRGVNLEATRLAAKPLVWLCAHIDTKSQPIPTLVRVIGLVLSAVGYNAMMLLAIIAAFGVTPPFVWWAAVTIVTLVGVIPVGLSVVTSRSPGALDNASGVAAVVEAARQLSEANVGVLITDAEELGLAGARAWCTWPRDVTVLNCDGVDDEGANIVLLGARPGRIDAAVPASVARRKRIAGVLTDANAFADAGLSCVTFMRGGWSSLARVHSRTDDLAHLRGTGIAEMASLIANTARQLGARS